MSRFLQPPMIDRILRYEVLKSLDPLGRAVVMMHINERGSHDDRLLIVSVDPYAGVVLKASLAAGRSKGEVRANCLPQTVLDVAGTAVRAKQGTLMGLQDMLSALGVAPQI
jgi:hypothetical protein